MAHECTRVYVPDDWDLVPLEIGLHGFLRAPVGGQGRKFSHNQRFYIGSRGLFIIGVRAYISYVGISQTNYLAGIAWIGENFLVTGQAGIENDFAAPPAFRSRGATFENPSVFKRKCGRLYGLLCQRILPDSLQRRGGNRQTAEVVHRPI